MEPPHDAAPPPEPPPLGKREPVEAQAAAAPPEPPGCPRCGAPHDPFQEYCLECGARLVGYHPQRSSVWRRETWTRDSPLWFWATFLSLLLIALVAAVIVLAATGDRETTPADRATEAQPPGATTQIFEDDATDLDVRTDDLPNADTFVIPPTDGTDVPTLPETDVTPVPPTPTPPSPPSPTPPPTPLPPGPTPPPTPPPAAGGMRSWAGSGYTVIIASIREERGRGAADGVARQAIAQGLTDVGVLNSSNYSSLVSGYWVAFAGVHSSLAEARTALSNVRQSGYPTAYVREVTP